MRQINTTFEEQEYNRIIKVKDIKKMNWHDFILWLVEQSEKEVK